MKYSKFMDGIHHYVRPLWSIVFGIIFDVIAQIEINNSKEKMKKYNDNLNMYLSIETIYSYIVWFKENFKYKYDGPFGILDHDNLFQEYFLHFGDCDDCEYTLKKIDYFCGTSYNGGVIINAFKIGMIGRKPTSWHYDVVFETREILENGTVVYSYYLFNYGNIYMGDTLESLMKDFCEDQYWSKLYDFNTIKYWKCDY